MLSFSRTLLAFVPSSAIFQARCCSLYPEGVIPPEVETWRRFGNNRYVSLGVLSCVTYRRSPTTTSPPPLLST
ncbi:hypothetical protein BC826DRAFT_1039807 [Russula brevipes]|nr:hypothetical protein BC826DRAFT_1039807 [Russula brevipes]